MTPGSAARVWHLLTAVAALFGVVAQLVSTLAGDYDTPGSVVYPPAVKLQHFFGYFTVQSNLLVAGVALSLAADPRRDGPAWRVLRLSGLTGITVTGLVHYLLLRPLSELAGWLFFTDLVVHVVVPGLALLGWLVFGPRRRVTGPVVLWALTWPVAWLAGTLAVGAASGWYPYPFLDVPALGPAAVAITGLTITALFLALSGLVWLGDRLRWPADPRPAPRPAGRRRG